MGSLFFLGISYILWLLKLVNVDPSFFSQAPFWGRGFLSPRTQNRHWILMLPASVALSMTQAPEGFFDLTVQSTVSFRGFAKGGVEMCARNCAVMVCFASSEF